MKRTLYACAAAVVMAALLPGQEAASPERAALARAKLLEEQEGDLAAAKDAYRALLEGKGDAALQAEAALRLGKLLWRLDQKDDARPFLERAVDAGGEIGAQAQAVLQGVGPDSAQEAEIAARVKDALARMFVPEGQRVGDPDQDLMWFGAAAVPTLIRELEARRGNALELGHARFIVSRIWLIGGADAERYLRTAITDPDVQWRQLITPAGTVVRQELLPVVEALLRDSDAEVVTGALFSANRLPLASVLAVLESPHEAVRRVGWKRVSTLDVWKQPRLPEGVLEQAEPYLLHAVDGEDPEIARASLGILLVVARSSTRAVELILERLPRLNRMENSGTYVAPRLSIVLRAARQLGPWDGDAGRSNAFYLANVARIAIQSDPDRTAGQLLELTELGYDANGVFPIEAVKIATEPGDLVRAIALIARSGDRSSAAGVLASKTDLPAETLPYLEKIVGSFLGAYSASDRDRDILGKWMGAIVNTGASGALVLQKLAKDHPAVLNSVIGYGALPLARRTDAPEVTTMLREFLFDPAVDPSPRYELLCALMRRGDLEAVSLYPRLVELGLPKPTRVAQWLLTESVGRDYRNRAFGVLFSSDALPDVLADLANSSQVPFDVMELLAPVLATRISELQERMSDPQPRRTGHQEEDASKRATLETSCRNVAWRTPADSSAAGKAYRDATAALLAAGEIGQVVATCLPTTVIPQFATRLREMLLEDHPLDVRTAILHRMLEARMEVDAKVWKSLLENALGSPTPHELSRLLAEVQAPAPADVIAFVERMTTHEASEVRVAACAALGRIVSADSVSALLAALRDPDEKVRAAATDALQRIRLYSEQSAFWQQFQQGITTGREAATAKLLAQCKADQPKDQRLLAIRSLGVLDAPEALPYLIEWTSDADAEIAAAARATVALIHQTAGAGK